MKRGVGLRLKGFGCVDPKHITLSFFMFHGMQVARVAFTVALLEPLISRITSSQQQSEPSTHMLTHNLATLETPGLTLSDLGPARLKPNMRFLKLHQANPPMIQSLSPPCLEAPQAGQPRKRQLEKHLERRKATTQVLFGVPSGCISLDFRVCCLPVTVPPMCA